MDKISDKGPKWPHKIVLATECKENAVDGFSYTGSFAGHVTIHFQEQFMWSRVTSGYFSTTAKLQ